MNNMFQGCCSLKNIPIISSWKLEKIEEINKFLSGCCSSKSISNLSDIFLSSLNKNSMDTIISEDYSKENTDSKESNKIDEILNELKRVNYKDAIDEYYENFYN